MVEKMVVPDKDINFRIALHEPEIPANTGNIGRLCVGSNSELHIIKPMRFLITDKYLKRAGLDYWAKLKIYFHDDLDKFLKAFPKNNIYFCTTKSTNKYSEVKFQKGDIFLFGAESKGLPEELLHRFPQKTLTIPMTKDIRSINLANSVAVILYEAWRQQNWIQEG
jgi:tRNA (cytidine/uridine-2'-O-)-methyltransferase